MNSRSTPRLLVELVQHLRRRGLAIGIDDVGALRQAMSAGFGWKSNRELTQLCVTLWAKTKAEQKLVEAAVSALDFPRWMVPDNIEISLGYPDLDIAAEASANRSSADDGPAQPPVERSTVAVDLHTVGQSFDNEAHNGAPLYPPALNSRDPALILSTQFPVTEREITQAWRRLRRIVRFGPPLDFDIDATLKKRAEAAVAVPPVLVPRRRNTARLVILIDRGGSMTPFHDYVDYILRAITKAGRLDALSVAYFHNSAGPSRQNHLLDLVSDPFVDGVDAILSLLEPVVSGRLFADSELAVPTELSRILEGVTSHTGVAVISDGGAIRGNLRPTRLVDTICMLKALYGRTRQIVWLNPLGSHRWADSTAVKISRHVPMMQLTRDGMSSAVDILRGRPFPVEAPL